MREDLSGEWPDIRLKDDGTKKPFSVSAYPQKLAIGLDPCGYGTTEAEALENLIDNIDEDISALQEAKTEAMAMLSQRRPT